MKKKFLVALATVAALFCLCGASAFAMGTDVQQTTGSVNLRTGPGTDYQVICVIPAGSTVYIEESANGWSRVDYGNNQGWMASKYLGAGSAGYYGGGSGSSSGAGNYYIVSYSDVNMRSGPGTGYSIITVLPAGSSIYVGSTSNGWAYASYGGYTGYVTTQYITGMGGGSSSSGSYTPSYSSGTTWYNGCNYANVYDYRYYMANNQDLVSALGTDPNAMIAHFVNYGMDEGRQAISSFNVYSYRDQHYDLYQRFGENLRMYYLYACGLA